MKNILITGGAGFIGSNLANRLLQDNYSVTILDSLSSQIHGEHPEETSPLYKSIKERVNFIKGSVTDERLFRKAIEGQEGIIHLAAETGTGQSMYEITKYNDVNVMGTAIMLDILANTPHLVEKVIVASSRAIYGEGRYFVKDVGYVYPESRQEENLSSGKFEPTIPGIDLPLQVVATSEESKIHPTSVYGITKQNQEQLVMNVSPTIGIAPVALRYQNVYGPGQSLTNPYTGILSIFSTQILNGHSLNIFEDGKESRDFVYVDDAVDATIRALKSPAANGHVFNVGTGMPIDVLSIAHMLRSKYKSTVEINVSGQYRLGDIRHNYADISRVKEKLNFNPQWTFENGIQSFTDWVKMQSINPSLYSRSIQEMEKRGIFKSSS